MKNLLPPLMLFCFSLFCLSMNQHREEDIFIDRHIMDVFEQYSEESGTELDFDVFREDLVLLYQAPLDLNIATREDIARLRFLSDIQIENIIYYRYKTGCFLTIYELLLVEGLDMTDIRRMLPFVMISGRKSKSEKIILKHVFKYGGNELLGRFDLQPEQKKGYLEPESGTAAYLGNSLYHQLKYRFHYKDRILFHVNLEKDAGEPFWGKAYKGYDFVSASFQVKDIGMLKNLIIGDYQVNFGQGLVIRQIFSPRKSSLSTNLCNMHSGFKRYGSTNEFNYLRGLAMTWQYHSMNFHIFYSDRRIDANIRENVFSGFYKTGYHRTVTELANRHRVSCRITGGNLMYNGLWFQFGLSMLLMKLGKELFPEIRPYNLFYFRGDKQWVSGIHYRFRLYKFHFFGEAAIERRHPAMISGMTYSPVSRVNLALLYRYYPPEYHAVFGSVFAESSGTGNEQGLYIGSEIFPGKHWKIAFYADNYRFPWLRQGADSPSLGKDFLLQLSYNPFRRLSLQLRVKYKENKINRSGSSRVIPELYFNRKSSFRIGSVYETGIFSFRQQVDVNFIHKKQDAYTYGLAARQEMSIHFKNLPLSMDLSYLFFDASDYENRLYMPEKDVLSAFSSAVLFGAGSRYYINLRYDISSRLSFWLKLSQIVYTDGRQTIGSGYEMIRGYKKTELKCLIRLRL